MRRIGLTLFVMLAACGMSVPAQEPSNSTAQEVHADLNHLMRGVLYPAANVVFFAQADNPGDVKPNTGQDPSMATDPLTSTFGGWQAVENAALALAEAANLLLIQGRTCSNGVPVPMKDPDWSKFVREVRDAGMNAYKAAQTKNQDKMIETAENTQRGLCRLPPQVARPADAGQPLQVRIHHTGPADSCEVRGSIALTGDGLRSTTAPA